MSKQARLGLIVLGGLVAFMTALFVLANRTFLLSDTYRLQSEFNDVGGLISGAPVQYQGVRVGRVEYVELPDVPGGPITVGMALQTDARPLVREDSRAVIQADGLVGNMMVVLTGGSRTRSIVEEGGTVPGVDPFNFTAVTDRLFESVARVDTLTVGFAAIMADVRAGRGTLGSFLYDDRLYEETVLTTQETRATLQRLGNQADAIVGLVGEASENLNDIIEKVNTGDGTLAQILNDDAIYEELRTATTAFSAAAADIETVTDRAEYAAGWAGLAMFRLAENMEALKENWFFKGYYEQRGYREQAAFEIREQALSETFKALEDRDRELYEREREVEAREAELGLVPALEPDVALEPDADPEPAERNTSDADGEDTEAGGSE